MHSFKIAFAGAGKVACALSGELISHGHTITQIVSPGRERGEKLASRCKAVWSDVPVFSDSADIIIVAVPDHKLKSVLQTIKCGSETVVAHTAGSFGLEVFPESIRKRGVFYPLQTFTPGREIRFSEVPVFIEAGSEDTESLLNSLGGSIGCKVYRSDLEHRQLLHVAAVFVCNFTNFMLTSGKEISDKAGFSFRILQPLIIETVNKAIENGPEVSQTGPALRHDLNTIEKHIELLSFSPELRDIYRELSRLITDHYKNGKG